MPVSPHSFAAAFVPLRLGPGDWQLVALALALLILALLVGLAVWHVWRKRYAAGRPPHRWSRDRDEHLKLAL